MSSLNEKLLDDGIKVKINFEGGDLTSNSGALIYGTFNEKLSVSEFNNKRSI